MLTAADLELRRAGVTATDATVITGVSPYGKTIHDVYLSKCGLDEPSEPTQAMGLGHRLEPVALQLLAETKGLTIRPGRTERSRMDPWILATPDADVMGPGTTHRIAVAEAKAVGFRMAYRWGESEDPDAIPDEVRVQTAWQMVCTETKKAYVVALIGTEARFYEIDHDPSLADALVTLCGRFWRENVLAKKPPELDGSENAGRMVRGLFKRATVGIVPAPPEAEALVQEYLAAKELYVEVDKRFGAAKTALCASIGSNTGLESDSWLATWKSRAGATDWKTIAAKLGSTKEMAEEIKYEGTRVLHVKVKENK